RGFTLVELLVSILLIDLGLLALVAGSAVIVREVGDAHARSAAVHAAIDRLESAGAGPCVAAAGDADGPHGMHEHWTVTPLPNRTHEIVDSVTYPYAGTERRVVLRTR